MAAITAAVSQYDEEARVVLKGPHPQAASSWKYWAVGQMMQMRVMWQLRMCASASSKRR